MELETPDFPKFKPNKILKTYAKTFLASKKSSATSTTQNKDIKSEETKILPSKKVEELSTKNAVTFLLEGTLASKVCKYCLNVTEELYELEKTMEIASKGGLYSVTVKDMIASFHPFKVADDPNFPNKICDECLDRTINSYLFTQQCEQAERAIANCFEDIHTKLCNLDPIEGPKHKRGRKKIYVNHNIIEAEFLNVIDYADPIIHIINTKSESLSTEPKINPLECLKCWQVLPDVQALSNHSKTHSKSMWFSCRLCGLSFAKLYLMKRHYREHEQYDINKTEEKKFECRQCGEKNEKYHKHIQHLEKHKFKMVVDHLIHGTMDRLCSICLDKGNLVPLDKMVSIHGGPPDLMGDKTMQSILASSLLEMTIQNNYTGSKICENCVNSAITSYVFMANTYFVRERLNTCLSHILDSLKDITPEKNLCIEIAKDTIMPMKEPVDESIFIPDEIQEDIKKEVFLEDEYRIKSEEEIEPETDLKPKVKWHLEFNNQDTNNKESKNENEQVKEEKYLNGYQIDICSEFLTFKKKPKIKKIYSKFTCPLCNKHFLSDYYVKRHILKHISKKVKCNPCGTVFGNKFSLNEHTKYAHILFQSDYRACKTCGRGFAKTAKLKHHEKQHKNKLCLLCNKVFKTQSYYDVHMQRHIPKLILLKKKYGQSCSFCEKECSNDNQLSLHVNKVHLQIKPYSCDMCEKQFYTEYNLRFHKKVHSKYNKEKCNFCSKVLKSRKLLVIHIRKHIGATPHICQICSQSFYSKLNLKQHMNLTHGGSLLCKICKHVSVNKNELKVHVDKVHCFS